MKAAAKLHSKFINSNSGMTLVEACIASAIGVLVVIEAMALGIIAFRFNNYLEVKKTMSSLTVEIQNAARTEASCRQLLGDGNARLDGLHDVPPVTTFNNLALYGPPQSGEVSRSRGRSGNTPPNRENIIADSTGTRWYVGVNIESVQFRRYITQQVFGERAGQELVFGILTITARQGGGWLPNGPREANIGLILEIENGNEVTGCRLVGSDTSRPVLLPVCQNRQFLLFDRTSRQWTCRSLN